MLWTLHRLPPSVVATIEPPPPKGIGIGIGTPTPTYTGDPSAAQQSVEFGHEMLEIPPTPNGRSWVVQVAPPSVEASRPPPLPWPPAAQQTVVDGQAMVSSGPPFSGTCPNVQVAPP